MAVERADRGSELDTYPHSETERWKDARSFTTVFSSECKEVQEGRGEQHDYCACACTYQFPLRPGGTDLPAYYQHHVGYVISATSTRYCLICILRERKDGGLYSLVLLTIANRKTIHVVGPMPLVEPPLALPAAASLWFLQHGGLPSGVETLPGFEVRRALV